jgi:hypothetical protein
MNRTALAMAILVLASGCNRAPWKDGLVVTGTEEVNTVTISYKLVDGEGPAERTGTHGAGETCTEAAAATGRSTATTKEVREHNYEVIGTTHTDHPLDPEEGRFGRTAVSVVAQQIRSTGTRTTNDDIFPLGDDSFSNNHEEPDFVSTDARYFGLAGDEYLVQLYPLDLWTPVSFSAAAEDPSSVGPGDRMSMALWTRRHPKKGDVWTSLDGRLLYRFMGKEKMTVEGKNKKVAKVEVYHIDEHDPEGSDLLSDCLITGTFTDVTTMPGVDDEDNTRSQAVILDGACEGKFVHQKLGTEWWWDDVLVKAETTSWDVTVTDWGYEWFLEEDAGCVRQKAAVAPDDGPSRLFMEYTVTTTESSYKGGKASVPKGK